MQSNQGEYEVVRDILTLLQRLKDDEAITITANKHGSLIDWNSDRGTVCGWSETACAIRQAVECGTVPPDVVAECKTAINHLDHALKMVEHGLGPEDMENDT